MKMSQMFIPTLREDPSEAEVVSHKYMLRGGYIRKLASGIYNLLPLGNRVIKKIENIVREEMDSVGALEILMPSIIPHELWVDSGRWDLYGKELLRVTDRHDREFCYGPTHEEVITDLIKDEIRSYKNLPINLYQIQNKFRDEIRPRFGLMRSREFTMKDAYSFHATKEDLDNTFDKMYQAYCNIFERCGLEYKVVDADSGMIGGNESKEFMVTAETGEDEILCCPECGYASNMESAVGYNPPLDKPRPEETKIREVSTPNCKTAEELRFYFMCNLTNIIKSIIYLADDEPVLVMVRGDHEVSDIKLQKILGCKELKLADDETIVRVTGAPVGFAGPVGLQEKIRLIADDAVMKKNRGIIGANKEDYHLRGATIGIDIVPDLEADIRVADEGDSCIKCKLGKYTKTRGIEVGHIFKLGTKYSEAMNATFMDENGKDKPFVMGCYGIGIGRTAAAAIEQNHDEKGIIWPAPISPYLVNIIIASTKNEEQVNAAQELYEKVKEERLDVILDDRNERIGVKFKDAELIGYPINIVIGKRITDGIVEVQFRSNDNKKEEMPISEIVEIIKDMV